MPSQSDRAVPLRALHRGPRAFVIANAWDAGSARALAALGFPALATSSGAQAGVLGRRDGAVTRDEALAHCGAIAAATDLPVSADLEKGDRKSTRLNSSHGYISYAVFCLKKKTRRRRNRRRPSSRQVPRPPPTCPA